MLDREWKALCIAIVFWNIYIKGLHNTISNIVVAKDVIAFESCDNERMSANIL